MEDQPNDAPPAAPARASGRSAAELTPRRALVIAAAVVAVLLAASFIGGERLLDDAFTRPLAFRFRVLVGRAPTLDPKIRAYALDDRAVEALGGTDLTVAGWTKLLETLAVRKPRLIMIDKTFSYPVWSNFGYGSSDRESDAFVRSLRSFGLPVIAKAASVEAKLTYANELPADQHGYSLAKLVDQSRYHRPATWLPEDELWLYGPERRLLNAFAHIGHDAIAEAGLIQPMVNTGATLMVPHWTLFAAGEPSLDGGNFSAGTFEVPVDGDGRIVVNLMSAASARADVRSLAEVASASASGRPVDSVQAGDTVVILPDLYAGASAYLETALGRLPAGFVQLAMINSAVSNRWLTVLPISTLLIFAFGFAAVAVGMRTKRHLFTAFVSGGVAILPITALTAFAFGGVVVPWLFPATAYLGICVLVRGEAVRLAQRRAALLRHDLHGMLSPERLNNLESRDLHRLEATEQVVTIMFIDIVGFSRAAEKQTPREAFSSLKSLIDQLRRAVHDHGGVVDRTMGDGMLCVFGYDLESTGQDPRVHAEAAVQCAAKIQKDNLRRMLKAHKTNQAVFPLRIGINTTGVYLGNLGDTERTDLTVIGNGVNFAQRLEAACDRHMAMLGSSTRDLLLDHPQIEPMLRKRHIRVKHATELTEAYELDPFFAEPQLLLDGDEAYRQFIGIERNDVRNPVPYPGLIRVMTNYGDGEMINFSFDGFTIKLPEYYAKDVTITLRMDTADGSLSERLEVSNLASLVLEVRWARPADEGFVHGCLIKNLNKEQRENVISLLRDAIQRHVAAERKSA